MTETKTQEAGPAQYDIRIPDLVDRLHRHRLSISGAAELSGVDRRTVSRLAKQQPVRALSVVKFINGLRDRDIDIDPEREFVPSHASAEQWEGAAKAFAGTNPNLGAQKDLDVLTDRMEKLDALLLELRAKCTDNPAYFAGCETTRGRFIGTDLAKHLDDLLPLIKPTR